MCSEWLEGLAAAFKANLEGQVFVDVVFTCQDGKVRNLPNLKWNNFLLFVVICSFIYFAANAKRWIKQMKANWFDWRDCNRDRASWNVLGLNPGSSPKISAEHVSTCYSWQLWVVTNLACKRIIFVTSERYNEIIFQNVNLWIHRRVYIDNFSTQIICL